MRPEADRRKAHDPDGEVDARDTAEALVKLHGVRTGYNGWLPPFTAHIEDARRILAERPLPALAPDDRAFLIETERRLSAALADRQLTVRPLHGDAHLGNVLATAEGPRWMDFEAACLGPIEWDLTALGSDGLGCYPNANLDVLELMRRVRSLCVAVWCWAKPQRAPKLRQAAEHHLQRLRAHECARPRGCIVRTLPQPISSY